jgi:hypothetical protein
MSLPEPCEARRVVETKGLQAASSGLELSAGCLSHCHENCYAGFPRLAGFKPAPTKKTDPSSGGRCFAARAKTHPRNPPKPPSQREAPPITDSGMLWQAFRCLLPSCIK